MLKKKHKAVAIALPVSLLSFLMLRFVVYGSAYGSLAMMLGLSTMENIPLVECAMLLVCAVVFANVYQLASGRLFLPFIKAETILYFVVFVAIIMLKSRGVQEVNFDIFDIYRQIIEYPESVVLNILLFIPMGALVYKRSRSVLKASAFALIGIVAIEVAQYCFRLGIADVVDVAVDMAGFLIGCLTLSILHELGFRIESAGDSQHVKVVLYRQKGNRGEKDSKVGNKAGKRIIAATFLFAAVFAVFLFGFCNYDYQEYVPNEAPAVLNTDETLNTLNLSSKTSEELETIIDEMNLFRVDGVSSSRDWVTVIGDGRLLSEGRISNYQSWSLEDGSRYYGLSLGVLESLEGVVVTHGVPLVVTPQTRVTLSDDEIDIDRFVADILPNYYRYKLVAEYSLQDGWFRADVLRFEPHEDDTNYFVWFDYVNFTNATNKIVDGDRDYWLDIPSGIRTSIKGYVDILHEDINAGNSFTLRIPDKIGNAMICHSFEIAFSGAIPPSYTEKLPTDSGDMMDFYALFENGKIVYAD